LAAEVARQLMDHDALGAHARDEIGITDTLSARPLQAALTSMVSFVIGGVVPLLMALLVPMHMRIPVIAVVSLSVLATLGAAAARAGGAPILQGAVRVLLWGGVTMGVTGAIGALFNTVG
jgi:VIT1/CCC1 family predicted Fe2+/Mn2+ transporter